MSLNCVHSEMDQITYLKVESESKLNQRLSFFSIIDVIREISTVIFVIKSLKSKKRKESNCFESLLSYEFQTVMHITESG